MSKYVLRIILRKILYGNLFGRRRSTVLVLPLIASFCLLWYTCGWLILVTSRALQPPPPPDQDLHHFRRNRNLEDYLSASTVLIEPGNACGSSIEDIPLVVFVTTAPQNFDNRMAVRQTWGKNLLTYFVTGVIDDHLVDTYVEGMQYNDLLVFDVRDHYQNLTLKTALILQWFKNRCPLVQFLLKTDDDVLINPWNLNNVLQEHEDDKVIGYRINDTSVHRDEYTKWYIPRWLYNEDTIPQYLSGTAYLISGEYALAILRQAKLEPLVNLEDVYFTYLVAHRKLGYKLSHDRRLSPYKPWLNLACAYWSVASVHSLSPDEMVIAWEKIKSVVNTDKNACSFYNSYLDSDMLFY